MSSSMTKLSLFLLLVGAAWGQMNEVRLLDKKPLPNEDYFCEKPIPEYKGPIYCYSPPIVSRRVGMELVRPEPLFPAARGATLCTNMAGCSAPEPMDVPAIRGKEVLDPTQGECALLVSGFYGPTLPECRYVRKWTCTDKSRYLMKRSDGSWHCLKF